MEPLGWWCMGECFFWYRLTRVVPDRTEGCKMIVDVFIIVYYAIKAANIHSYTYKNTIKIK